MYEEKLGTVYILCSKYILLRWRCANYLRLEQIHTTRCPYYILTQYAIMNKKKKKQ